MTEDAGTVDVTFNGRPLSVEDGVAPDPDPFGKGLSIAGTASCWSSGGSTGPSGGLKKTFTYRADALRLSDIDAATGKFKVNGTHTVRVPDSATSSKVPTALGASLVVVYRDTSVAIEGFYQVRGQKQRTRPGSPTSSAAVSRRRPRR